MQLSPVCGIYFVLRCFRFIPDQSRRLSSRLIQHFAHHCLLFVQLLEVFRQIVTMLLLGLIGDTTTLILYYRSEAFQALRRRLDGGLGLFEPESETLGPRLLVLVGHLLLFKSTKPFLPPLRLARYSFRGFNAALPVVSERRHRGTVQWRAVRRELGAMTRTVPALLERVPVHNTSHMR